MARKRSRYSERTRVHRRRRTGRAAAPGSDNTMLIIGGVGVVAALVLVAGLLVGRQMGQGRPPSASTPGVQPTAALTATVPITATSPITGTDTISPTGGIRQVPVPTHDASVPGAVEKPIFAAPGDGQLDPALTYLARIETDKGAIVAQLLPDIAPITVNSFVYLVRTGFYDGVTFHRVIPGFVAQGGDPTATGLGGPGYALPAEFSDLPAIAGALAMARKGDDINSAGSQFFIVLEDSANNRQLLDGQYTIFGQVVEGLDVARGITARDPQTNPTGPGDKINKITIEEKPQDESSLTRDKLKATGQAAGTGSETPAP